MTIDGSKFKAVNNRDKNFTKAKVERRRTQSIADRGYFNGEEIKTCLDAGITVTLPKPMTSWAKAEGRFGKEDFVYPAEENVYRVPDNVIPLKRTA